MYTNDGKGLFQITPEEVHFLGFIARTNPHGVADEWNRLGRKYGFNPATVEPADVPERFWAKPAKSTSDPK